MFDRNLKLILEDEYWIINGVAEYADGDVGEMNHESYVYDQILNDHGLEHDDFEAMSLDELIDIGMTPEEIAVFDNNNVDPRTYAIDNWEWIRVADNNIEMKRIDKNSLNELANGLYECFGDKAYKMKYDISVIGDRSYYSQVPFSVISDANIRDFKQYKWH